MKTRYDINGNIENEFEPGSDNKVLKNLLGITDPIGIGEIEFELLAQTEKNAIEELTDDFVFTSEHIYKLHREWLGKIYVWAGKPRTVSISKGNLTFCLPGMIEKEMARFEEETLLKHTPCTYDNLDEIAFALAEVHGEFEVIHPFREGNGRVGRLISTLMANQAGLAAIGFNDFIRVNWKEYLAGLEGAWGKNYETLTALFRGALEE